MKKKAAIILGVLLLTVLCVSLYHYCHPTHYSFNDRYVIGKPLEKITDRYGKPYSMTENTVTYMIRDDTPEWIMSYDDSLWYVIEFEEDVAVRVSLRKGYPGG